MSDAMGEMLKRYDCNHVGLRRDLGKIVAISNKGKSENQMTVASVEARAVLG